MWSGGKTHITETGGLRTLESAVWVDRMGGASQPNTQGQCPAYSYPLTLLLEKFRNSVVALLFQD